MRKQHWYFMSGACACNAFWAIGQGMTLAVLGMVVCAVVYWNIGKKA